MNIAQFKQKAAKVKVNTNNAWGFGGHYGTVYYLGDFIYTDTKFSYRHMGDSLRKYYSYKDKNITLAEFKSEIEKL